MAQPYDALRDRCDRVNAELLDARDEWIIKGNGSLASDSNIARLEGRAEGVRLVRDYLDEAEREANVFDVVDLTASESARMIQALQETADALPAEHHEKPGLIRAIEILKYE